ncbi:La-type HTH domain [Dillenia turbinata]|uniref:La-type HTH domain n=1 Tax=Dillenia turbinata TaxID=194707 RepID=A0AAN8VJ54_9MAGN
MAQDSSSSLAETLDSSLSINSADDHSHPSSSSASDPSLSRNVSFSRLNARAPEFVPTRPQTTGAIAVHPDHQQQPRLVIPQPQALVHVYPSPNSPFHPHVPVQNHHVVPVQYHHPHPHHHHNHHQHHQTHYGGGRAEQDGVSQQQQQGTDHDRGTSSASRNGLSEEATQKLLNQVEYYFSDINLATTDHLMRFINKDPEGFAGMRRKEFAMGVEDIPISVVASFKKIKALISSNSQLASVLRHSTKLAVSEDGKKVKRQHPLTESDMEELQSRIVVAENLPEDHCHQNLMKVFSAVGSVKTIRTCQPQTSSGGASASRSAKADGLLYSNKLHAFVEYESVELAEKAVAGLNDEGNWRSGLRVRLFHRRTSKPVQMRGRKVGNEGEGNCEEEGASMSEQQLNDKHMEESTQLPDVSSQDHAGEEHINDKEGGQRKGRNRGRGKGRGKGQHQNQHQHHHSGRGSHVGTPPTANLQSNEVQVVAKQPPGPRMPDGTRGFSMGRGKPVTGHAKDKPVQLFLLGSP